MCRVFPGIIAFCLVIAPGALPAGSDSPQPVALERTDHAGRLGLRDAIAAGLEKNPLLEVRRAAIERSTAAERETDAAFDPVAEAGLRGGSTRQASAASELDGSSRPESESATLSAALRKPLRDGSSISLEWDTLKRESNSAFASLNPSYDAALRVTLRKPLQKGCGAEALVPSELARLEMLIASGLWQLEIESLLLEIEKAYWEIDARARAVAIRRQDIEVARLLLEETAARGGTKVEILEARANLVRREAGATLATKEWKDSMDTLFLQTGLLRDNDPGDLKLDPLPDAGGPVPEPLDVYCDALSQGTNARLEDLQLAIARTQVQRARYGLRPTLDLTASAGLLGRDDGFAGANSALPDADGRFYQAGIEWSMPWGSRAEKARLDQAESRLAGETSRVETARLSLYSNCRELCRRVALGLDLLAAAREAVSLNQARFEEQRTLRSAGRAVLRDVLEAQTALQEARLAEIRSSLDVVFSRLDIERARGTLPARHHVEIAPPSGTPRPPT